MIKAVVFDVDGTLVDSVDMHAEAWQRAFKEFDKEIEFSLVRSQIGKGGDQLMPVFLSKKELDEIGEKIEERRGEIFQGEYLSKVKAFPMVREVFERVKNDGKLIALASSAPEEELEFYKNLTKITDLLEAATSSDDAKASKPEPDIFEEALAKIDAPNMSECIVIGDTPYDAIAAGKIGFRCVGVLCGGFPEQDLRDAGCIEIYRDPADLLANYDTFIVSGELSEAAAT